MLHFDEVIDSAFFEAVSFIFNVKLLDSPTKRVLN